MAYQLLDVAQTTAGLRNFFAAAVMKDLWPECEDALLIPISRNRVRNQTAIALAL